VFLLVSTVSSNTTYPLGETIISSKTYAMSKKVIN